MLIIVSGNSGSGKSTVSRQLSKSLGCHYVDVDILVHRVLEYQKIKDQISKLFGSSVLKNNRIDRKELGKIVFSNSKNLQKLEELTWSEIDKELQKIIKKYKNVVLDYLLLPISHYFEGADKRILTVASDEIRYKRIAKRDGVSTDYVKMRDKSAPNFSKYKFDYKIDTSIETDIERQVREIVEKIKSNTP